MKSANEVMDRFMELLSSGSFVKDNQPNDGPELNQEFVDETVSAYSTFLKSGILDIIPNA